MTNLEGVIDSTTTRFVRMLGSFSIGWYRLLMLTEFDLAFGKGLREAVPLSELMLSGLVHLSKSREP